MANVSELITLGIGTPSSVPYLIWFGLGPGVVTPVITGGHRIEALPRGSGEKLIRSMEQLGRTRIERF